MNNPKSIIAFVGFWLASLALGAQITLQPHDVLFLKYQAQLRAK